MRQCSTAWHTSCTPTASSLPPTPIFAFAERLIRIYRDTGRDHSRYFDPSLMTSGVTPETPFLGGAGGGSASSPTSGFWIWSSASSAPENLLQSGPAHTHQAARAPAPGRRHRRPGAREPLASGQRRGGPRRRPHRHAHGMDCAVGCAGGARLSAGDFRTVHRRALRTHCPGKPGRPFAIPDALLETETAATPVPTPRRRRDPDAQAHHPRFPFPMAAAKYAGASTCVTTQPVSPPVAPNSQASWRAADAIHRVSCVTRWRGPDCGAAHGSGWPPIRQPTRPTAGAAPNPCARRPAAAHFGGTRVSRSRTKDLTRGVRRRQAQESANRWHRRAVMRPAAARAGPWRGRFGA